MSNINSKSSKRRSKVTYGEGVITIHHPGGGREPYVIHDYEEAMALVVELCGVVPKAWPGRDTQNV
jgi:hypothetical protein